MPSPQQLVCETPIMCSTSLVMISSPQVDRGPLDIPLNEDLDKNFSIRLLNGKMRRERERERDSYYLCLSSHHASFSVAQHGRRGSPRKGPRASFNARKRDRKEERQTAPRRRRRRKRRRSCDSNGASFLLKLWHFSCRGKAQYGRGEDPRVGQQRVSE